MVYSWANHVAGVHASVMSHTRHASVMSQVCMHQSYHTHVMHESCHTLVMHQWCHTLVMHQSCHTHVMHQSHTHPILCGNAGKGYSVFGGFGPKICMSAKVSECARDARPFWHSSPPKKGSLLCLDVWIRVVEISLLIDWLSCGYWLMEWGVHIDWWSEVWILIGGGVEAWRHARVVETTWI